MTAIVIVPAFDCYEWLPRCLASVAAQTYANMRVIVVDDNSDDERQRATVTDSGRIPGWTGVINSERRKCPRNIYDAVHEHSGAADGDVIILCDGDDRFISADAVTRIMAEYDAWPECLLTYGSYASEPHDDSCPVVEPYPPDIVRERAFRGFSTVFNHTISFRFELFKRITESELQFPDGTWFDAAYDQCLMYPMLELAGPNHRFIPDRLYGYNAANPASESKVHREATERVAKELLSRPKRKRLHRTEHGYSERDDNRAEQLTDMMNGITKHDENDNIGYDWCVDLGTRTIDYAAVTTAEWRRVVTFHADLSDYDLDYLIAVFDGRRGRLPIFGEVIDLFPWVSPLIPAALWWIDGTDPRLMDLLFQVLARRKGDVVAVDDAWMVDVDEVRGQVAQLSAAFDVAYDVSVSFDIVRVAPMGD